MIGKHSFNEFVEIVEDLKQVNQNLREERIVELEAELDRLDAR